MTTPRELVALYASLGERIAQHSTAEDALAAVTQVAVEVIANVHFASITRDRGDHLQTLVPTLPLATEADQLQYELRSGPCVAAATAGGLFVTDDLAADARWPVYGPRAGKRFDIGSMLSVGMVIEGDLRAGLNLYSRNHSAFDDTAQTLALLLATQAAMAVSRVVERERAANLEKAMLSSRRIGTAVGIVMSTRKLTADQAFALLRIASQNSNRRLALIADEVTETGWLDLPRQDDDRPRSGS